jgi:penicillin amidase
MRYFVPAFAFLVLTACKTAPAEALELPGLEASVEGFRDPWGINHIYAANEHDLFYTQGYLAARDRLFQFEIWRRQATGTVAEILGERELQRDIGTRLFRFRGELEEEFNHYHENGSGIIRAFTDGVNAYIDAARQNPDSLPVEFRVLGILPEKWTPEVVISRHQGLLGNIEEELAIGRAVAHLGPEKVDELLWFHPKQPDLTLHPGIDSASLSMDILGLYEAYRKPVAFKPEDVLEPYRNSRAGQALLHQREFPADSLGIGSNNWVVGPGLMASGKPFMANDPHRSITVPSLRYMAHLVAPGWDVIGGGEPEIPGISIGHNGYGAWGLTVFETDGEDLYVYNTHPSDPDQYEYQGAWVEMETVQERIAVKGRPDTVVTLKYTRHGPVVYQDAGRNKAYAVRCAWLEPGGSPYLASLRMDQARSWEEFREACAYSHIPGENMIWADADGNIGWQAVGIAPIRRNFSGLVPVPGDGRFEWEGYLPIKDKPHAVNPKEGFIATANQNVTPGEYTHWDAIGYTWADSFRGERIEAVLSGGSAHTLEGMQALQVDYLSLPARTLVPYLERMAFSGLASRARELFRDWDYRLEAGSQAAAVYVAWENAIKKEAYRRFVPREAHGFLTGLQLERILQWVEAPQGVFGDTAGRDAFLRETFLQGVEFLSNRLGDDPAQWQYGQDALKHIELRHALSAAVSDSLRRQLDLRSLPRGGNGYTPGATGNNFNQSSGATFRILVPVGDWDQARAINSPGQSGDPESPYYKNLYDLWGDDGYFPLQYSRDSIEKHADSRLLLRPR